MHLNELPCRIVITDLETITELLDGKNNRGVSLFVQMIEEATVITSAEVRAKYKDFTGQAWDGNGLDHVEVRSLDRDLQDMMASMVDTCVANGLDPLSRVVQMKLVLVAIALMADGCVVSVDTRDTDFSMGHICGCFNVPFLDAVRLEP